MPLANTHEVQDALFIDSSTTLPATAGTEYSSSFDTMNGPNGSLGADCALKLVAPAMTASFAAETIVRYRLYDSLDDSSYALVDGAGEVARQTFAAGVAGAAANTVHAKLPTNVRRYVKIGVTTPAGAGDLSANAFSVKLTF